MNQTITHWTASTNEAFQFRVASDFVAQLEMIMDSHGWTQAKLANKLGVTEGRVSQILNNPGNLSIGLMVKCVRALGMKMGIVLYGGQDTQSPINPEVFRICWERCGKPEDFWALQEHEEKYSTTTSVVSSVDLQVAHTANLIVVHGQKGQMRIRIDPLQKLAITEKERIDVGQLISLQASEASSEQYEND